VTSIFKRPATRSLAAVFLVALAVRLIYVGVSGKGAAERAGDAADYHAYAASLVDRGDYVNAEGLRASRMPGYPLMLAAQYAVLGRSPIMTQLWQCLLGALTCILIAALVGRTSPAPWPLVAGLFAAFCFDLIEPCARLLTEAPAAFFATLTLWLISEDRALGAPRAAWAGAAAGAAFLCRPELGPWAALVAFHAGWRSRWSRGALVLAGPLIAAALWAGRNAVALGAPVATTTAGAFNLYGWGIPRTLEERFSAPPWERAPASMPELAAREFYAARTRRFFLMEGKAGAIVKAAAFNAAALYYPFSPGLDATFVFLSPLAAFGLFAAARDGRRRLLGLSLAYATGVYAVAGVMIPRHRETFAGIIVVLAAAGLEGLKARLRPRLFATFVGGWGAACAAAWALAPWLRGALLSLRDLFLS
jgi:hypothetical protein